MTRLVAWVAAILVAALLVWAFLPEPVPVEVALIGPQTFEVTVEEEGEARIREVYTVSAAISGKLQRIGLHPGDPVVAGETIVAAIGPAAPALLDTRARAVAEATIAAAQSGVDLAQAQLAEAEAQLDYRALEAARAAALFDRGTVSQRVLDDAVLGKKTAEAEMASARASLAVRGRELESARAVLGVADIGTGEACCVLVAAPVSGRVLRVMTEDEQVVQAGTPILEIGDTDDIEITSALLSRDAVRVVAGANAAVTGWGGPSLQARVRTVDPSAETRTSALGIDEQRVKVTLAPEGNPDDWRQLGHGFRVTVQIALWRGEGVLAIPVGALFRDGSEWATFVVRNNRAELQLIQLGERSDDYAEVLDGLQAGDAVILHPSDQVAPGTKVVTRNPGE